MVIVKATQSSEADLISKKAASDVDPAARRLSPPREEIERCESW
jgi:hypothetical protein